MSYTTEQREKNDQIIEIEMAGCEHADKGDVRRQCMQTWATEDETRLFIKQQKEKIAKRATPSEIDEIFKFM